MTVPGLLRFGAHTLDLDRLRLNGPSGETELRRKCFEVLRYLVEHPGRVVTKDELILAVWGDAITADESLARCVCDVRRALADDDREIIRTVPRRGYLFDAPVSSVEIEVAPPPPRDAAAATAAVPGRADDKAFVVELIRDLTARQRELAELNAALERRVTHQMLEIERLTRLRRFVPAQVADLMLGDNGERYLTSHRREVAVLACDLDGFASRFQDTDAVTAVLIEYHASIGTLSRTFEAMVERFAGDGVTLVFNDPLPCADPPGRAVRFADALRRRLGRLTQTWRHAGRDIGFRIGIAYGHATLGVIGCEGRCDYAAVGTVPSLASALCARAARGQVLMSESVLAAVTDVVGVAPATSLQISGFARPVRAFALLQLQHEERTA